MSEIEEEIRRQMIAERQRTHTAAIAAAPRQYPGDHQEYVPPHARKHQGGIVGILTAIGAALAKFGAPLLALLGKLKFLLIFKTFLITGGSMIVSMWAWSMAFGWPFAVGIVLLIFVHESGHAIAGKALGHPIGPMVFMPFMGAFVSIRRARNIVEDAFIGIMGPVFGTVGGVVCLVIYQLTGNFFWAALAQFNFFINLFNLLPMPPLDGSWITPLFSPKLLLLGVVLLFVIAPSNPMIWILGFMSLPRIIGGWKAKPTDQYYRASNAARWKYGLAYLGLAAFLGYGYIALHETMVQRYRPGQQVVMQVDQKTRS